MSSSNVVPFKYERKYDFSQPLKVGTRNDYLFRLGCSLRSEGWSLGIIGTMLHHLNEIYTEESLEAQEVDRIVQSIGRYPQGEFRDYLRLDELGKESAVIGRLNRTLLGDAIR